MHEWSAELIVEEHLARALIAGQCFTPRALRLLGEGWDNTVWLADERWVFRFPRREVAIAGVQREIAVLGKLAPQLPLPVPAPRWVGEPDERFPWPFFGAELIGGRELADASLTEEQRCALGRPLGEFLRALHDARVDAPLPDDPNGRADMGKRIPLTVKALEQVEPYWRAPSSVHELLDDARGLPVPRATVIAHGDLHLRHLLVDGGAASGVIDWGDVCRGDPSIDLPLVWCALPPDGRADFFAAYGSITEEQLLRARLLSIFLCAVLAYYGAQLGLEGLHREALRGLERSS